jgi:hypothetical protein
MIAYDNTVPHTVSAYDGEELVGCGRVITEGDQAYVVDLMVVPEYRQRDVEHNIVKLLLAGYKDRRTSEVRLVYEKKAQGDLKIG